MTTQSIADRINLLDWEQLGSDLDENGFAVVEGFFSASECEGYSSRYDDDALYRKHISMSRYSFGKGDYKYFKYPLPDQVQEMRQHFYSALAPIANRWNDLLSIQTRYPSSHALFMERCEQAGQLRSTPALLRYEAGGYNCLHQDVHGDHCFPLQVAILLSQPGEDFTGGEFVMTEQRPRKQSHVKVVPLRKGDMVIMATSIRPNKGARGYHRANLKHGVSLIREGNRSTLAVIFHDSK